MATATTQIELQSFPRGQGLGLDIPDTPAGTATTTPGPTGDNTPAGTGARTPVLDAGQPEFSLPPVDGGKDAWLFLAACFAIEALVWGFPFAFGVFQDYYSTHEPFAGQPNIAVVGTCSMGAMYLLAPILIGLCRKLGRWAKLMPVAGLLVMCISLAMSSFCQTVPQLIATQGFLYALGGGAAYCPCILYMDEWFVRRKGLAYGVMWSGTGLAGMILPLVLESLLNSLGFRTTLRIWSGILFCLTAPLTWYIKPRLPYTATSHFRPFDFRFLLMPNFLLYQAASIVEAAGFFLPGIYLPTFARSVFGAEGLQSAATILLVNVASVFGCVAMGYFTDRFHVTTCILLSTVGATLGTFLLWGLSSSLAVLYVFCAVYGFFAGSFTSTWSGIMREAVEKGQSGKHGFIDPIMVFGWLAAGRGVGNVISGPVSELLIRDAPWKGQASFGYGSGYGTLIVFTGVTALVGGSTFVWRRLGLL